MVTISAAPSSPTPRIDRSANHWRHCRCVALPSLRSSGRALESRRGTVGTGKRRGYDRDRCERRQRRSCATWSGRRWPAGNRMARTRATAIAASGLTGLFCPAAVGGAEPRLRRGHGGVRGARPGRCRAGVLALDAQRRRGRGRPLRDDALRTRWAADLAAGRVLGGFSLGSRHGGVRPPKRDSNSFFLCGSLVQVSPAEAGGAAGRPPPTITTSKERGHALLSRADSVERGAPPPLDWCRRRCRSAGSCGPRTRRSPGAAGGRCCSARPAPASRCSRDQLLAAHHALALKTHLHRRAVGRASRRGRATTRRRRWCR